ncbi:MAG: metal-binding protein [Chloroflexia bacterium]
MPAGRTHDLITVVTAAVGAPLTLSQPGITPGQVVILGGAYLLSGIMFSCDLDLRSEPYLRWGRFRFIWWPYQKVIHHRAVWSHGLIIGPVLRIIYFTAVMFLLLYLGLAVVNLLQPVDPSGTSLRAARWVGTYLHTHGAAALLALLGFVLGGASHTIADIISTAHKHWRRRHRVLGRFL